MKNDNIRLLCELCPRETGVVLKLGDLRERIPALNGEPKDKTYQHGICPTCQAELESGCTFFCDSAGRVMKASLEATREKINPEYHGKVVRIPRGAMDAIVSVWMSGQKTG